MADEATPATGLTAYSNDHPLILLTDYPAETEGGGAVILRSLLGPEERRKVVWMSLAPSDPTRSGGFETVSLTKGSAGRARRRSLGLDQTVLARELADEAIAYARARRARAFWVVLHGAAVQVANRLACRHALPIHATVHDDPAFANALRSKRYIGLVPWIDGQFNQALIRSDSVDVISEAMADRYRRLLGVEASVVHRGLADPVEPAPTYDPGRHGLRIGVLGSTYSYGQLPKLGWAVARASRELGVPGKILLIGRSYGDRLRAQLGDAVEVEATGHIDESEGVARLRDCFALYVNYPFAKRDLVLGQTSFPTKLSSYVQAARPLILHVPEESSVMPLLDEPRYAAHWNSLHPSDGAEVIRGLWERPGAFDSQHEAAERVRLRYFDRERNQRTLFDALNGLVTSGVHGTLAGASR